MVFYYAAKILDAWLAAIRALADPRRTMRALGGAWRALPGDLMGLIVMRGCGIRAPSRIVDAGDVSAVLVENPDVGRYFDVQMMPVQAQTLGRYVFARGSIPEHTLEHEIEHIRQWQRFGPLYLPLYFGSSAVALFRGRRPYWDNLFESAARLRADREMAARFDGAPS
ncbi:MAG: hypothetical protein ACXWN4_06915 [Candidatus Limnocylindrales bacterium]